MKQLLLLLCPPKFNANGDCLWGRRFGGSDDAEGASVAIDGSNLFIAGSFNSASISFDSHVLTRQSGSEAFIAKLNIDGTVAWAKMQAGAASERGFGIATDNNGGVYLAGTFDSPVLSVGTHTLTSMGNEDIFVTKYAVSNGDILWAKAFGDENDDTVISIDYDGAYGLIISGNYYSDTLTFGNTTLTNLSGSAYHDMYVTGLDMSGSPIWAKSFGSNGIDNLKDVAIKNGIFYATGEYGTTAHFDGTVLTNQDTNNFDVFLAKLAEGTLSISKWDDLHLTVYPNPVSDFLHLNTDLQIEKIEIYDIAGKKIYENKLEHTVDTRGWSKGIYFVKATIENKVVVRKIVKD